MALKKTRWDRGPERGWTFAGNTNRTAGNRQKLFSFLLFIKQLPRFYLYVVLHYITMQECVFVLFFWLVHKHQKRPVQKGKASAFSRATDARTNQDASLRRHSNKRRNWTIKEEDKDSTETCRMQRLLSDDANSEKQLEQVGIHSEPPFDRGI